MAMLASSSSAIAIAISISITPSFSRRPSLKIRTLSKITASSSSSSFSTSSETPESQYFGDLPRKGSRKRLQIAGVDQDELSDPWLLADADSRFAELHGVQIHYKIARPNATCGERTEKEEESKVPEIKEEEEEAEEGKFNVTETKEEETLCEEKKNLALPAVILLHGFGGSLFSFERVLKPLSSIFRSPVLAFDRPGFGLTSRVKLPGELVWPENIMTSDSDMVSSLPINPYSIGFSSSATLAFMDFVQSKEAVLMGHSAGCIVATEAYFKAPERIAAMILVAPALFAPLVVAKKEQILERQDKIKHILLNVWEKIVWAFTNIMRVFQSAIKFIWSGIESCLKMPQRLALMVVVSVISKKIQTLVKLCQGLWKICLKIWEKILWVFNGIIAVLPSVIAFSRSQCCRLLTFILRSGIGIYLIRVAVDKLSLRAVRMAWFNMEKVDNNVISGYTKALKCKNWEYGLLEYVIAQLGESSKVVDRLSNVLCPVLVIAGDNDAIVPAWNAKRLAKLFPNGQFHIIRDCGHLPFEEKPEEFAMVIKKFIQKMQNATCIATESEVFMPV